MNLHGRQLLGLNSYLFYSFFIVLLDDFAIILTASVRSALWPQCRWQKAAAKCRAGHCRGAMLHVATVCCCGCRDIIRQNVSTFIIRGTHA